MMMAIFLKKKNRRVSEENIKSEININNNRIHNIDEKKLMKI